MSDLIGILIGCAVWLFIGTLFAAPVVALLFLLL
jgi:hypothetical protein